MFVTVLNPSCRQSVLCCVLVSSIGCCVKKKNCHGRIRVPASPSPPLTPPVHVPLPSAHLHPPPTRPTHHLSPVSKILPSQSFTSAGGERVWEEFVLSQAVMTSTITVVAVEGPDKTGYPVLRFVDLRVTGTPAESNSIYVRFGTHRLVVSTSTRARGYL